MRPERFEQLVSDWLDQPQRADLREQIAAALRAHPELAKCKTEHEHLHDLLRDATASGAEAGVRWPRFRQETHARVREPRASTVPSDDSLRRATTIGEQVDWDRFRADVMASIGAESQPPRRIRFPRLMRFRLVASAAAAVVALFFLYPMAPTTPDSQQPPTPAERQGYARVSIGVSAPATSASAMTNVAHGTRATNPDTTRAAIARVTISVPPPSEASFDDADAPRVADSRADSRLVEVFLMVEPQRPADRGQGAMNPLTMN